MTAGGRVTEFTRAATASLILMHLEYPDTRERQRRHIALAGVGEDGVAKLAAARIAVVGAGGLATPALTLLAGAEVGALTLLDFDTIERHNLARQTLYREGDLGELKAERARAWLAGAMPHGTIETVTERLTADNAAQLLAGHDVVLDTTDHWPTRFAVADACAQLGVPLVWGSVVAFDGMCTVFAPGGPGIDALINRDRMLSCPGRSGSVEGTFSPLCGQVGSAMAGETIKLITGVGSPLIGRVQLWDTRNATIREMPLRAHPQPAGTTPEGKML